MKKTVFPELLCRYCGICCMGILFNRARAKPKEKKNLTKLKMRPFTRATNNKPYFPLPCPQFKLGVCSVYSERFSTCQEYRCHLLKQHINGEPSILEALQIVDTAKNQMATILGQSEKTTPKLSRMNCLRDYMGEILDRYQGENSKKASATNQAQLKRVIKLLKHLSKHFRPQLQKEFGVRLTGPRKVKLKMVLKSVKKE
jgi:uncharacterized protein